MVVMAHFTRARSILEQLALQSTRDWAEVLSSEGQAWLDKGRPPRAMGLFLRALALGRKAVPADHPLFGMASMSDANDAIGNTAVASVARAEALATGPDCTRKLRQDGPALLDVKCRRTFYSCQACQTADWKREGGHRAECGVFFTTCKCSPCSCLRSLSCWGIG